MQKKLLGYCAVDSGQLIIVDPCYLNKWKDGEVEFELNNGVSNAADNHYAAACAATSSPLGGGEMLVSGIGGTGVVSSTGWGDGSYPVYAHYGQGDDKGRIMKLEIDFGQ